MGVAQASCLTVATKRDRRDTRSQTGKMPVPRRISILLSRLPPLLNTSKMKMSAVALILVGLVALGSAGAAAQTENTKTEPLEKLAADFWNWRAKYAPFTGDDVNRIERPGGTRDWSRAAINNHRKELAEFEARWKKIDASGWPIPQQVDYRLIGSALARVRWEFDMNPRWKRDPTFYIEQTLTPIVEALTVPAPYDEARSREILTRVENVPSILQQG